MYEVLADWLNQFPVSITLKDGTVLTFIRFLEVYDECIELVEKDTEDIYLLRKEDILFAKVYSSDIPEA